MIKKKINSLKHCRRKPFTVSPFVSEIPKYGTILLQLFTVQKHYHFVWSLKGYWCGHDTHDISTAVTCTHQDRALSQQHLPRTQHQQRGDIQWGDGNKFTCPHPFLPSSLHNTKSQTCGELKHHPEIKVFCS